MYRLDFDFLSFDDQAIETMIKVPCHISDVFAGAVQIKYIVKTIKNSSYIIHGMVKRRK